MMSNEIYEERLLVFIDILGFKKLIQQTLIDSALLNKLNHILHQDPGNSYVKFLTEGLSFDPFTQFDPDFRVTSFSDCIVITASNKSENQNVLILLLSHLFTEMAGGGIFFRGAITQGLVHHSKNIIYGPALVKAYELESEKANYPRIILDPEVSLSGLCPLGFMVGKKSDLAYGFSPLKKDEEDNLEFVNAIGFAYGKALWEAGYEKYCIEFNETNIQERPYYWREWPDTLTSHIVSNLETFSKDEVVRTKYEWLANYFNNEYFKRSDDKSKKISI